MKSKRSTPIPETKLKTVAQLSDLIKKKKTILLASIKDIPASQFQLIGKKLRGKAIIKFPKKNLIFRAIDNSKDKELEKLKEQIQDSVAILFSDQDSFDLALELIKNKNPAKAKVGQIAPRNIEVDAGPTELVPGPAISELGALGIQIQIEKGKIHIKESKIIVKEGAKISQAAADIMGKLDIKPFTVGFTPLCAFDNQEKKLYLNIQIDVEGTKDELKTAFGKALPFAVEIGYITEDTIKVMVGRAASEEKRLIRVISGEPEEEIVEEASKEEVKEEKKEEEKAPAAAGLGALFG